MAYQYYDLHDQDFEKLVTAICSEILGDGVECYSKGRDKGIDGHFHGNANTYPSKSKPWIGKTIIQAKHTTGVNKHFGESSFFNPTTKKCIISDEIIKVNKLIKNDSLHNYLLISNRKLTTSTCNNIRKYISQETGLNEENIAIFGVEMLDKYLSKYSYIAKEVNLQSLHTAPLLRPDDFADIIERFSKCFNSTIKQLDFSPKERTDFEEKNTLNKMTFEFSKQLQRQYLSYISQIKNFITDSCNDDLRESYQTAIEEFQLRFIIPAQKDGENFDNIFNDLVEILLNRDYVLSTNVRLTRIMVFYMYWMCDIGISKDD